MMKRIILISEPTNHNKNTTLLGRRGEKLAAEFLERRGYRLVAANFTVPVGRNRRGALVNAEIDLIGYDGATLCFIEVKTRSSADFAAPESAVDLRKQRQITRAARLYRKIFYLNNIVFRYDVVSVVIKEKLSPKIELFRGFWTEEKFKRKKWIENNYGGY
jgi:putative endonuclease